MSFLDSYSFLSHSPGWLCFGFGLGGQTSQNRSIRLSFSNILNLFFVVQSENWTSTFITRFSICWKVMANVLVWLKNIQTFLRTFKAFIFIFSVSNVVFSHFTPYLDRAFSFVRSMSLLLFSKSRIVFSTSVCACCVFIICFITFLWLNLNQCFALLLILLVYYYDIFYLPRR